MDFFPTDIESDSDQVYGRDFQPVRRTWSRQPESSRHLSCSIQGFTSFDTSLMDEDDIPTRDAGLDLSFPNQTSSNYGLSEPDPILSVLSTDTVDRSATPLPGPRNGLKKKKTKSKRRREATERSRNNNSLNMQDKLEQIEKGEFFDEEVTPDDCADIPIDRRPSGWEVDRPLELTVTSHNVDMLLISARFYQQSQVVALCREALIHCDLQNALYFRFVAEKHDQTDITRYVQDYVRANFMAIVHTHSFLGLGLDQLRRLLCDDGLKVSGELDVFHAARAWIDHCKHARIKVVGEVMACVRFIHICPEDIVRHVEPHKNYFRGPGGREVLLSIYRYHALQGSQSDLSVLQADLPPPRRYVPRGMEPTVPATPVQDRSTTPVGRKRSSVSFSLSPVDGHPTWTPVTTPDGGSPQLDAVRRDYSHQSFNGPTDHAESVRQGVSQQMLLGRTDQMDSVRQGQSQQMLNGRTDQMESLRQGRSQQMLNRSTDQMDSLRQGQSQQMLNRSTDQMESLRQGVSQQMLNRSTDQMDSLRQGQSQQMLNRSTDQMDSLRQGQSQQMLNRSTDQMESVRQGRSQQMLNGRTDQMDSLRQGQSQQMLNRSTDQMDSLRQGQSQQMLNRSTDQMESVRQGRSQQMLNGRTDQMDSLRQGQSQQMLNRSTDQMESLRQGVSQQMLNRSTDQMDSLRQGQSQQMLNRSTDQMESVRQGRSQQMLNGRTDQMDSLRQGQSQQMLNRSTDQMDSLRQGQSQQMLNRSTDQMESVRQGRSQQMLNGRTDQMDSLRQGQSQQMLNRSTDQMESLRQGVSQQMLNRSTDQMESPGQGRSQQMLNGQTAELESVREGVSQQRLGGSTSRLESVRQGLSQQSLGDLQCARQVSSHTVPLGDPAQAQLYARQHSAQAITAGAQPGTPPQSPQLTIQNSRQLVSPDGLHKVSSFSQNREMFNQQSSVEKNDGAHASVRTDEEGDPQDQQTMQRGLWGAVGGHTQSMASSVGHTSQANILPSMDDWNRPFVPLVPLAEPGHTPSVARVDYIQRPIPVINIKSSSLASCRGSENCFDFASNVRSPVQSQHSFGQPQTAGDTLQSAQSGILQQRGSSDMLKRPQSAQNASELSTAPSANNFGQPSASGTHSSVLSTKLSSPSNVATYLPPSYQTSAHNDFAAAGNPTYPATPDVYELQGRSASCVAQNPWLQTASDNVGTSTANLPGAVHEQTGFNHHFEPITPSPPRLSPCPTAGTSPQPSPDPASVQQQADHGHMSRPPSRLLVQENQTVEAAEWDRADQGQAGMLRKHSPAHKMSGEHGDSPDMRDFHSSAQANFTVSISDVRTHCQCSCSPTVPEPFKQSQCRCQCTYCLCFCSTNVVTDLVKQHCDTECCCTSPRTQELTEKQLDEMEERLRQRKKEMERKGVKEAVHEERYMRVQPTATEMQSQTSIRIRYCHSPQCTPNCSPKKICVTEHLRGVREEQCEDENESNIKASGHVRQGRLFTKQADVLHRKRSVTFTPQLADLARVCRPPARHNSRVHKRRLQRHSKDPALTVHGHPDTEDQQPRGQGDQQRQTDQQLPRVGFHPQREQHTSPWQHQHRQRYSQQQQQEEEGDTDHQETQLSPQDRQLSPEGYQRSPQDRQLSPEGYQLSPQDRQLSPEGYQRSPQDRQLSSEGYQWSPQDYQCNNLSPHSPASPHGRPLQRSSHSRPHPASPVSLRQATVSQVPPQTGQDRDTKGGLSSLLHRRRLSQHQPATPGDACLQQHSTIPQPRHRQGTDPAAKAQTVSQARKLGSVPPADGRAQAERQEVSRGQPQTQPRARDPRTVSRDDRSFNENAPNMRRRRESSSEDSGEGGGARGPLVSRYLDYEKEGSGLIYRHHPYTNHGAHQMADDLEEGVVVVVGGMNPHLPHPEIPCRLMDLYDPGPNTWSLLGKLPEARHHHGCVMLDGYLYVIGGSLVREDDLSNMTEASRSCYRYDFGGDFWTAIAPLACTRMYHGVAALEGIIYAVGGETSDHCKDVSENNCFLDSCEYYNPDTDEWGPIANMKDGTIGAAVIGFRGLVWVMGGFVEHNNGKIVLAAVECYDPRTNSWISMKPLPAPVCHAGVVQVMDTLFVVGGAGVTDPYLPVVSSPLVLQYLEVDDAWVTIAALTMPRHDATCCTIGSRIYVLGGICSLTHEILADVECLDVATGQWDPDLPPLSSPAMGSACVPVSQADFN